MIQTQDFLMGEGWAFSYMKPGILTKQRRGKNYFELRCSALQELVHYSLVLCLNKVHIGELSTDTM